MMLPFPFAISLSSALPLGFLTVRRSSPHAIRKCANCELRLAGDRFAPCRPSIRCGLPFFLSAATRPETTAGTKLLRLSGTGCLTFT